MLQMRHPSSYPKICEGPRPLRPLEHLHRLAQLGEAHFNVIIRSLQYRADTGYLSFQVGSAITYDSVPEHEYQECLLKARAMLEVLKTIVSEQ